MVGQQNWGWERTLGSETSQYQEEKKQNMYFLSSGERKGRSPNPSLLLRCDFISKLMSYH